MPWGGAGTGFPVGSTGLAGVGSLAFILPSGDTSGVTDATAIMNCYNSKLLPVMTPGIYYWAAGIIVITTPSFYVVAVEGWRVLINGVGTGDLFRMYSTANYPFPNGPGGGGILGGPVFDGSAMGAGSCAIHFGDIFETDWDVRVRNFQAAGSKGFWFDNQFTVNGAEQARGRILAEHNTVNVQFDNSTGPASGSFDRANLDIFLNAKGVGDGVVLTNGAEIINGRLGIWGNFDGSSTGTQYAAIRINGSNANNHSQILRSHIDLGLEVNTNAVPAPQTIVFGTLGFLNNVIQGCAGIMDFAGSSLPFQASPVNSNQSFQFDGPVYGDVNLMRSTDMGQAHFDGGVIGNNGAVLTRSLSAWRGSPAGNVTGIILQSGYPFSPGMLGSQQITVINEGAGSMTFDVAATSHVADGVADVIQPLTAARFIWDYDQGLWYRCY